MKSHCVGLGTCLLLAFSVKCGRLTFSPVALDPEPSTSEVLGKDSVVELRPHFLLCFYEQSQSVALAVLGLRGPRLLSISHLAEQHL